MQRDEEMLSGLIVRHYLRASYVPPVIYLPLTLNDKSVLEKIVSQQAGRRVQLRLARQGAASDVSEIAFTDARFRLRDLQLRASRQEDFVPAGVRQLQEELDLPRAPELIEAIDVSHVHGSDAVAAVVAFRRGTPLKSRYRKLKLRNARGGDDPAGIAEAVERHFKRLLEEKEKDSLPDLLLIDGGSAQLSAAVQVLNSLDIDREKMPVLGLAKRLEEVYMPGVEGPQSLARRTPAIRLLQRVRDEVHRFAVGYHRQRRAGRVRATLLTEVNGVGEQRARTILQEFGSVTRMIQAGEEALARVEGVGPVLARRIIDAMGGSIRK
jgi:excinuclease ABC subunit C